ncbi:DUF917 domain-containing protein [Shewanella corallii]|uniref:DUF917 domain-containing protein n=1 Tax=Shewanella corallii TaxID=560080 RepID=A0ABT0N5P3_9GAMM|nr:DUF917 domain-containing protein [Shewanella corallii]MCL2913475.1 DUF917 domain-containing protein [Shewanella corallii]
MIINTVEQIKDLTRGAVFLGTGGGGDPYVGELLLLQEIRKGRHVRVIKASELADDAQVVSIAGIGAPSVLVEHLQSEDTCRSLVAKMEAQLGKKIDAIIPAEIGGLNSIIPMAVSAQLGLPVIDADGMGRAFPHLEMVTFSVYGSSAVPICIANEFGDSVIIEKTTTDRKAEDLARGICANLGAMIYSALYPMSGAETKAKAVHNTLSYCMEIGRGIREAREQLSNPIEGIMAILEQPDIDRHARILFEGKVIDINRETRDGWHWASVVMAPLDGGDDRFELDIQNEYLQGKLNGKTTCLVPDLIATLDLDTCEPLTAEALKYGQRLRVIGTAAAPIMRRPECLKVFGPAGFGMDDEFVPLEAL